MLRTRHIVGSKNNVVLVKSCRQSKDVDSNNISKIVQNVSTGKTIQMEKMRFESNTNTETLQEMCAAAMTFYVQDCKTLVQLTRF